MDNTEKLTIVKTLVEIEGDAFDSALTVYLTIAGQKILNRTFPYDSTKTEVPSQYEVLQCEIAAYLWNKRGAEGQTSHSENGISRSYENADVPASMLKGVVPFCGTFREVSG